MNQKLLQGTENLVCTLELMETKEQLEVKNQKVKELQGILRDKENEIQFLKDILSSRTTLTHHQQNTIVSLQQKIRELMEKAESPVIDIRTYAPEMEEELAETAI